MHDIRDLGLPEHIEQKLLCRSCKKPFNRETVVPKFLGCGHSTCTSCLVKMHDNNKNTLTCSKCNKLHKLNEEDISRLTTNTSFIECVEMCANFDSCYHSAKLPSSAIEKCSHCNIKFCTRCKIRHMYKLKQETERISEQFSSDMSTTLEKSASLPSTRVVHMGGLLAKTAFLHFSKVWQDEITKFSSFQNDMSVEDLVIQTRRNMEAADEIRSKLFAVDAVTEFSFEEIAQFRCKMDSFVANAEVWQEVLDGERENMELGEELTRDITKIAQNLFKSVISKATFNTKSLTASTGEKEASDSVPKHSYPEQTKEVVVDSSSTDFTPICRRRSLRSSSQSDIASIEPSPARKRKVVIASNSSIEQSSENIDSLKDVRISLRRLPCLPSETMTKSQALSILCNDTVPSPILEKSGERESVTAHVNTTPTPKTAYQTGVDRRDAPKVAKHRTTKIKRVSVGQAQSAVPPQTRNHSKPAKLVTDENVAEDKQPHPSFLPAASSQSIATRQLTTSKSVPLDHPSISPKLASTKAASISRLPVIPLGSKPRINIREVDKLAGDLHKAARHGDFKLAMQILNNSSLNASEMEMLVEHEDMKNLKRTPIQQAVESGCLKLVEELVENRQANYKTPCQNGRSAHLMAVGKGYKEIVKFFLPKFEDSIDQQTAILRTAIIARNVEIIKEVLNHYPTLIYYTPKDNMSWLMNAAEASSLEVVRFFCSQKVNCFQEDSKGNTALHYACKPGRHEIVDCLLDWTPELIDCKNHAGQTALAVAMARNCGEIVKRLRNFHYD